MVDTANTAAERSDMKPLRVGLDIGSTTVKAVVLDQEDALERVLFSDYRRHHANVRATVAGLLEDIHTTLVGQGRGDEPVRLAITGSGGLALADSLHVPFIQEVIAETEAIDAEYPQADVIIELGGEDAKILFLSGGTEVRMNGSCAGGTGAFIDQMATLLKMSPEELNKAASRAEKTYTIASRCGVFAKSDIQALLNQGAQKNDIAQSILTAVVNQTIAGLAQGREIEGKVVYLGGPLTFLSQLRAAFDRILGLEGVCPENSLYYVAAGAALSNTGEEFDLAEITGRIAHYSSSHSYQSSAALFHDEEEYQEFTLRHQKDSVPTDAPLLEDKVAYVGIDAGSTTVKAVAVNSKEEILFSRYLPNSGNPVPLVRDFLQELYKKYPDIDIRSSASTGYGEEIIKNAFGLDMGVVETIAHFTAAKKFDPQVDFIIDIGGQDIQCLSLIHI